MSRSCRIPAALAVMLSILLVPAAAAAGSKATVTDDTGAPVSLTRPARRIISLSPHLTELLFSAGAGDRVVGTVQWSDYPKAARRIPRIGNTYSLDLEKIMSLRPDLVVAWLTGNGLPVIDEMRRLGLAVYVSEPRSLDTIGSTILRLGILAGSEAAAKRSAAAYFKRLRTLRSRYSHRRSVSVFYQIWNQPMFTVNRDHVISNVIDLCGGRNVFADLDALSPRIDVESVLAADPQVIVASGIGAARPPWLNDWLKWPALKAVRLGLLFSIPPDFIQRDTVRILQGATLMCRDLDDARTRLRRAASPDHSG